MMRVKICAFAAVVALFFNASAVAQSTTGNMVVYFHEGSDVIDPTYKQNSEALENIVSALRLIASDKTKRISGVEFTSSTSPTGTYEYNKHLSERRLAVLEHYVRSRVAIPNGAIVRRPQRIGWSRLREMVELSDMLNKDDVLDILDYEPEFLSDSKGCERECRKAKLMRLKGGKTYRYLEKNMFDSMRYAAVPNILSDMK